MSRPCPRPRILRSRPVLPVSRLSRMAGSPRLPEGAPARRHRQGRHRQVHGGRGAGPGPGDPRQERAALRGRGASGDRADVRRRPAPVRRAAGRHRPPRRRTAHARASCTRCTSTRSPRCWSTSPCTTSSAGPVAPSTASASIEFATTIAPGRARRPADRQGLRGDPAQRAQQGRDRVRRGRARRAPDRADHPVPRRQQRAGRAGQGRPDQEPGRQGDAAAHAPTRRSCTW